MELTQEALTLANARLLAEAADGYHPSVLRVDRLDARRVELVVTLGEGPLLAIEWGERHDENIPAFARGEHFIASYNKRPGAWNMDDPDTPKAVRDMTLRLCRSLAESPHPCSLSPPPKGTTEPLEPGEDDPELIDRIVKVVGERLASELGSDRLRNPENWTIDEVRSFRYWRLVADIRLTNGTKNLGFLLFPTDPTESVYARTQVHDVVYYSDDIAIAQHHDELYVRDHETIDRFVTWLSSWDHELKPQ